MFKLLQIVILVTAIALSCIYIYTTQPELVDRVLLRIDVLGISDTARRENERLEKIRALSIPYEEKYVLVNRTVFMGASEYMVTLALGEPSKRDQQGTPPKVTLVYFLPNDKRPTLLVFEEDKLVNAYKGSSLDVGRIDPANAPTEPRAPAAAHTVPAAAPLPAAGEMPALPAGNP